MKKMKLVVDINDIPDLPKDDKSIEVHELAKVMIHNIMFAFAKNGLREGDRKLYYKTLKAIEDASAAKQDVVELDDDSAGFLRKCKREGVIAPSAVMQKAEELIDSIEDR